MDEQDRIGYPMKLNSHTRHDQLLPISLDDSSYFITNSLETAPFQHQSFP